MPCNVYDERGELLQSFESDIVAVAYAMRRQRIGQLTTMLTADNLEIMFAPRSVASAGRAETAVEYSARTNAAVKEEMAQPPIARPTPIRRLFGPGGLIDK